MLHVSIVLVEVWPTFCHAIKDFCEVLKSQDGHLIA
jgi:hypothetical protein